MAYFTNIILVETTSEIDILDITDKVQSVVESSGIKNGQVCVFVGGSTGSITTIEHEEGVVNDLRRALEKIAPKDAEYEHNKAWNDGNGYSHVMAAILGSSGVFPLENGHLPLGNWQQVVLIDLDNKGRQRKIIVNIVGE